MQYVAVSIEDREDKDEEIAVKKAQEIRN